MRKIRRKKLTFTYEDRLINSLLNDITVINNSSFLFVINPVWFSYMVNFDFIDIICNDIIVSWSVKWNKRIFPIEKLWK